MRRRSMFQAGISTKFSSQYKTQFHDTSLDAATAATARAERKLKMQEEAMLRQQEKIATELEKIEATKKAIQRKQTREARRVAAECNAAARVVQNAARTFLQRRKEHSAVAVIALAWQQHCVRAELARHLCARAAQCIAGNLRLHVRRTRRERGAVKVQSAARSLFARRTVERRRREVAAHQSLARSDSAVKIQTIFRRYVVRETFLDIRDSAVQIQAAVRGHLSRRKHRNVSSQLALDEPHAKDAPEMATGGDDEAAEPASSGATDRTEVNDSDDADRENQPSSARSMDLPRPQLSALSPAWRRSSLQLPKLQGSPKPVDASMLSEREVSSRVQPAKPSRHRRKTIAVTLSPMPYKTVLVHQNDGDSESTSRQKHHEDLRRKLILRKEQERLKEVQKLQQVAEIESEARERTSMEREEKRVRLALKLSRRREADASKRGWKQVAERESRENLLMEREERASRVAWKVIARLEADKLQRKAKQEMLAKAPLPVNRYERKRVIPTKPPPPSIEIVVVPDTAKSTRKLQKEPRDGTVTKMKKGTRTIKRQPSNQDDPVLEPPTAGGLPSREEVDADSWNDCEFDDLVDEAQLASLILTS